MPVAVRPKSGPEDRFTARKHYCATYAYVFCGALDQDVALHRIDDFLPLGGTQDRISDFSFGGRTDNCHEMVLDLVFGVDFKCVLHHFSSLTSLKASWGQVAPESGPKPKVKFRFLFPNIGPSQFRVLVQAADSRCACSTHRCAARALTS